MLDRQNRDIRYLRLSITDLCNFKCPYCLPHGYQGKRNTNELSLDEIQVIAQAAAEIGIQKIRITGGEPSLRSDLADIIEVCKMTEGIETVAMTTNGYLLSHAQRWFNQGLDQLNISIDSFIASEFAELTGHDMLDDIISHIDILLAEKRKLKINAVLQKDYNHVFDDALAFIRHRDIDVRFIELMETTKNKAAFFSEHQRAEQFSEYLLNHDWTANSKSATSGPANTFSHHDYSGRLGFITPYAQNFCQSCNRVRISSQGKLHLCLFDNQAYDLRPFMTQPKQLAKHLRAQLNLKPEQHHLQENNSGLISNLAMIGG